MKERTDMDYQEFCIRLGAHYWAFRQACRRDDDARADQALGRAYALRTAHPDHAARLDAEAAEWDPAYHADADRECEAAYLDTR